MNTIPRRPIDALLDEYSESHRHPMNEWVHIVCVPAITAAMLGLWWHLHPAAALAAIAAALIYYVRLSPHFAAGMAIFAAATVAVICSIPASWLLPASLAVFVLAWIGQFAGHMVEGRRPAFLQDLRFLLIGPLFVLRFLYKRMHIIY